MVLLYPWLQFPLGPLGLEEIAALSRTHMPTRRHEATGHVSHRNIEYSTVRTTTNHHLFARPHSSPDL